MRISFYSGLDYYFASSALDYNEVMSLATLDLKAHVSVPVFCEIDTLDRGILLVYSYNTLGDISAHSFSPNLHCANTASARPTARS